MKVLIQYASRSLTFLRTFVRHNAAHAQAPPHQPAAGVLHPPRDGADDEHSRALVATSRSSDTFAPQLQSQSQPQQQSQSVVPAAKKNSRKRRPQGDTTTHARINNYFEKMSANNNNNNSNTSEVEQERCSNKNNNNNNNGDNTNSNAQKVTPVTSARNLYARAAVESRNSARRRATSLSPRAASTAAIAISAAAKTTTNTATTTTLTTTPTKAAAKTRMAPLFAPVERDEQVSASVAQVAGNVLTEDRCSATRLPEGSRLYAVYDGHGGADAADFVSRALPLAVRQELRATITTTTTTIRTPSQADAHDALEREEIVSALVRAFDVVESMYLARCRRMTGAARQKLVGACALAALVRDGRVYAANAGDCGGLIVSARAHGAHCRKISHKLNANSKKERLRLQSVFPNDPDILVERGAGNFYVKNVLQPTRCFGDFRLKHADFAGTHADAFSGPYVTHKPDVEVFDIAEDDTLLVLGSDGLWENVTRADVARVADDVAHAPEALAAALLALAKQNAAARVGLTVAQVDAYLHGAARRNVHDDITILVAPLRFANGL